MNTDTFARATGIPWEDWLVVLGSAGGSGLTHRGLARVAGAAIEERGVCANPDWWAQSVAIAFERHIGRRSIGQGAGGTFSSSCSRTLSGTLDEVAAAWVHRATTDGLPLGLSWEGEARLTGSEKWRYWRCDLSDGTRLVASVGLSPREGRSVLTLSHEGLGDEVARSESRDAWRSLLHEVTLTQQ